MPKKNKSKLKPNPAKTRAVPVQSKPGFSKPSHMVWIKFMVPKKVHSQAKEKAGRSGMKYGAWFTQLIENA